MHVLDVSVLVLREKLEGFIQTLPNGSTRVTRRWQDHKDLFFSKETKYRNVETVTMTDL